MEGRTRMPSSQCLGFYITTWSRAIFQGCTQEGHRGFDLALAYLALHRIGFLADLKTGETGHCQCWRLHSGRWRPPLAGRVVASVQPQEEARAARCQSWPGYESLQS